MYQTTQDAWKTSSAYSLGKVVGRMLRNNPKQHRSRQGCVILQNSVAIVRRTQGKKQAWAPSHKLPHPLLWHRRSVSAKR